ncbi:MAG: helix-turn-helix domain-containing protein [Deltaproteobacteria bacterium]
MPPPLSHHAPVAVLLSPTGASPTVAAVLERAGFDVQLYASPEEARPRCRGASVCDAALADGADLSQQSIEQIVKARLRSLLDRLSEPPAGGLHALVMREVERGLLGLILERCRGHRGKAADQLGLHRNTRQKMIELGLSERKPAPEAVPAASPKGRRARR